MPAIHTETTGTLSALVADLRRDLSTETLARFAQVDERTVRRWACDAVDCDTAAQTLRLLIIIRRLAPELLPGLALLTPPEIHARIDALCVRHVSPAELERERAWRTVVPRDGAGKGGV